MTSNFVKPEQVLIAEKEESGSVYFLVDGQCIVTCNDENCESQFIGNLYPGSHFGELSLLYESKRSATVKTTNYCTITEMEKEKFKDLLYQNPSLVRLMRNYTRHYKDPWKKYLLKIMKKIEYFKRLDERTF